MIYRKRTYKIDPQKLTIFNEFFHQYLYPNQIKHGAKLVGRWVNDTNNEITAIWEYESIERYEQTELLIRNTDLHKEAKQRRAEIGELFIESRQEFLSSTSSDGTYHPPKHILSVSAFIMNQKGELLLVRNEHRMDTMEMPGGQVEEGETLEHAVHREVSEETGIKINLLGITGIYQNSTSNIICVVFKADYKSGEPTIANGETSEVKFVDLKSIDELITRKHFKIRVLDAIKPNYIPFEAYTVNLFEMISRIEVEKES